jgi:hypothetical protein
MIKIMTTKSYHDAIKGARKQERDRCLKFINYAMRILHREHHAVSEGMVQGNTLYRIALRSAIEQIENVATSIEETGAILDEAVFVESLEEFGPPA